MWTKKVTRNELGSGLWLGDFISSRKVREKRYSKACALVMLSDYARSIPVAKGRPGLLAPWEFKNYPNPRNYLSARASPEEREKLFTTQNAGTLIYLNARALPEGQLRLVTLPTKGNTLQDSLRKKKRRK